MDQPRCHVLRKYPCGVASQPASQPAGESCVYLHSGASALLLLLHSAALILSSFRSHHQCRASSHFYTHILGGIQASRTLELTTSPPPHLHIASCITVGELSFIHSFVPSFVPFFFLFVLRHTLTSLCSQCSSFWEGVSE